MTSCSEFCVTLSCIALLVAGCSSPSGPTEQSPAVASAPAPAAAVTQPAAPPAEPAAAAATTPAANPAAAPAPEAVAPPPEAPAAQPLRAPQAAPPSQATTARTAPTTAPAARAAAPSPAAPAAPSVTPVQPAPAASAPAAAPVKSVVDPGGSLAVPASKPGLKRIGADACGECHDVQHESWAKGAHAARKPPLDCESCHGPGSEYKANSVMKNAEKARAAGLVIPDKAFCAQCHKTGVNDAFLEQAHAHEE